MKTKMMKRAAAFAASVLMTAAMAVPVFAVNTDISGKAPAVVDDNKMTVQKKIYVFNTSGTEIYEPNVSYKYTVAPGSAGKKITGLTKKNDDGDATVTVETRAGIAGGVKLNDDAVSTTLAFGNKTETPTNTEGASVDTATIFVHRDLNITTDVDAIVDGYQNGDSSKNAAGVYRYLIKLDAENRSDAGVLDSGVYSTEDASEYYLDVYVQKTDTGYEVYGLVLSECGNEAIEYPGESDEAKKINELEPDEYHTANVSVEKFIDGALADKNHEFPFDITVSSAAKAADFRYNFNGETDFQDAKLAEGKKNFNATFKDQEGIYIYGVPMESASIAVTETNDTTDTYTAKVKVNEEEGESTKLAANSGTKEITVNFPENKEAITDIEFYNTLDAISPTGVLFRIAPYALMMTAGGVLIAVYLRGKKRDDAESMI